MNRDRWMRVKDLFHAALALPPQERDLFLATAAEDLELQDQVRSLLSAEAKAVGFTPGRPVSPDDVGKPAVTLGDAQRLVGRSLGQFRIESLLGAGGMGIVYRAHDTRLERPVAIKLIGDRSLDQDARRHLAREARHASALNHPNICTVYEIGDFDDVPFIAMEYVDGQSLAAAVAVGPVPVADALEYGRQIADALAHAHDRGIVHRDLKSANIAIGRDRRLKILDFGVARRLPARDVECVTRSNESVDGTIAGTVPYMAPEVFRGEQADARSDIWALGVVLYEALSARLPFTGRTGFELTSAILQEPPASLAPDLPASVIAIVERCLRKNPLERYQNGNDVKSDLELAQRGLEDEHKGSRHGRQESIAVLYFDNLSGRTDQEYLRDGVTEDVITELCKIEKLRVFPRSAVMAYRDKQVTAPEIGRQLRASYILAGSLRHAGSRVRISAQLIESAGGHTIWAERYDRDTHDVFALQEEIASSIARALSIKLSPQEKDAIARKVTNPVAYDSYLRGRRLFRRGTKQDLQSATEMFEHAVSLDPHFSLAYAALGHACGRLHRHYDQNPEWMTKGIEACDNAMSLDPQLPEALSARAFLYYAHEQYEPAIRFARMALDRKEDCEGAYGVLGLALFVTDRLEEVARLTDRAIETSGDDYNVYMPYWNALRKLGRQEQAIAVKQKHARILQWQIEWAPDNVRARVLLACSYAALGDSANAIFQLDSALASGSEDASTLFNAACTYGLLGRKADALSTLKRAVQNGYWHLDSIARDPDFAILHDEPEFQALIGKQNH
jgi:non-specific serine/threonine protein kinase